MLLLITVFLAFMVHLDQAIVREEQLSKRRVYCDFRFLLNVSADALEDRGNLLS